MTGTNGALTPKRTAFSACPAGEPVFTTGQVAKLCRAGVKTVAKWCDSGRLKSYRIPCGEDRRVRRSELARFLRAHGMGEAADELEGRVRLVLVVGCLPAAVAAVGAAVPAGCEVAEAGDEVAAAAELVARRPDVLVADAAVGGVASARLAAAAARHVPGCRRVLLAGDAGDVAGDGWEVVRGGAVVLGEVLPAALAARPWQGGS
jgi:excisionase family DNA binding protein